MTFAISYWHLFSPSWLSCKGLLEDYLTKIHLIETTLRVGVNNSKKLDRYKNGSLLGDRLYQR
ncbi:hypothetical protein J6590_051672 [Homalodisca vitripennis]|nr:hypothetical protein J6590_051672 [Homalodisca vitripennis]